MMNPDDLLRRARKTRPKTLSKLALSRRAAVALAGTLAATPIMASAKDAVPAGLEAAQFDTLVGVLRDLFPHDRLKPAVYREAMAASLKANATPERLAALKAGVDALNANGMIWRAAKPAQRLERLKAVAGLPFFADLRMTAIMALYHDQAVAGQFGYQGPSLELGGYLERGFDDLTWLPSPGAKGGGG